MISPTMHHLLKAYLLTFLYILTSQYYKSQLQHVQKVDSSSPCKSSNLRRRINFPKSFQSQSNQGNLAFARSNLGLRNPLPAASINRNQSYLQLQETEGSTSFSNELPIGLPNDGSQNLPTVLQNCMPTDAVHQNQSLLQSPGNATLPYVHPIE